MVPGFSSLENVNILFRISGWFIVWF